MGDGGWGKCSHGRLLRMCAGAGVVGVRKPTVLRMVLGSPHSANLAGMGF